jgi:plastocyanin
MSYTSDNRHCSRNSPRICWLPLIFLCAGAATAAADLRVLVTDPGGQPIEEAVVELLDMNAASTAPAGAPAVMRQKDLRFTPNVLIVPVGTRVEFPNDDPVLHHVYSFSRAKSFELRLYGNTQVPAIEFDDAGTVTLGCNIHDHMRAYIYVTDAMSFAQTPRDGTVNFDDVPGGAYMVRVWHSRMRKADETANASVAIESGQSRYVTVIVDVHRAEPVGLGKYERGNYD